MNTVINFDKTKQALIDVINDVKAEEIIVLARHKDKLVCGCTNLFEKWEWLGLLEAAKEFVKDDG